MRAPQEMRDEVTQPQKLRAITVYCDGLTEPTNPGGYACWAWVALWPDGRKMSSAYGCMGHGPTMTNNLAEYEAVLQALRRADSKQVSLNVYTDSKLVVEQAYGRWRVNAPHLRVLVAQVRTLIRRTSSTLTWIPREQNQRADELTRKAYSEARRTGV